MTSDNALRKASSRRLKSAQAALIIQNMRIQIPYLQLAVVYQKLSYSKMKKRLLTAVDADAHSICRAMWCLETNTKLTETRMNIILLDFAYMYMYMKSDKTQKIGVKEQITDK